MTRTLVVIVAACIALVITAAVSIVERDFVPSAPPANKPKDSASLVGPSPNSDGKRDKLPVETQLRQTYEADSPIEPGEPIAGPIPTPRPRTAGRPVIQKNYTLLSDVQIAAIKSRLRLTNAQEPLWPDVEKALRALARTMHDRRQGSPVPSFEADSAEVEQLKSAAQPLIARLSEDQKREVRALARLIGLDAVASQI